jgi:hypothetical protein
MRDRNLPVRRPGRFVGCDSHCYGTLPEQQRREAV